MKVPTHRGESRNQHTRAHLRLEALEDRTLLVAAVAELFPEVRVNAGLEQIPGSSASPDVGVASDGSFRVAFKQEETLAGGFRLYVRRFSADGTLESFNHTILVAISSSTTPNDHHIAVRSDGSFAVVHSLPSGTGVNVDVSSYASDGALVAHFTAGTGSWPDIAIRNSDGAIVVVWVDLANGDQILGRAFAANGAPLGDAYAVHGSSPGVFVSNPAVAIRQGTFPAGETAVAVGYDFSAGPSNYVAVERFADLAWTSLGEVPTTTSNTTFNNHPSLAIDGSGKLIVAWTSHPELIRHVIRFRTYDPNGIPLNQQEQIVGNINAPNVPAGDQSGPSVAATGGNSFIIAFCEGNQFKRIAFQQYRDNGIPVSGERFLLDGDYGTLDYTAISANSRGRFVISADAKITASSSPYDPFVRAYGELPRQYFTVASVGRIEVRRISDDTVVGNYFCPYQCNDHGGVSTAFGDVNGDGYDDLIVGGVDGPQHPVKVYDGAKIASGGGFEPFIFCFTPFVVGQFVASGDVDGDGYADIVAGASTGNPHVKVFAGPHFIPNNEKVLSSFFAFQVGFDVGVTVAVGDLNGDGYADVATGALPGNPHVRVFDGKALAFGPFTFDPLTNPGANQLANPNFFPFGLNFNIGAYVAIGDIYGNGNDLIVGASRGNPHVRVYMNADVLNPQFDPQISPPANSFFANTLSKDIGVPVATVKLRGDDFPADIILGVTNGPRWWRIVDGKTNGGPIPPDPVVIDGVSFEASFGPPIGIVYVGG